MDFKEWLNIAEIRTFGTSMQSTNSAARNVGRDANQLISCLMQNLKGWPIKLTAIGGKEDVELKIDGYFVDGPLNGNSVQIIRRIAQNAKDDFAVQIVAKQPSEEQFFRLPLVNLIKMYPAKLSAGTKIHLMLNADDDKLFLAFADDINKSIRDAVSEMENDANMRGSFRPTRSFYNARNGVSLRVSRSREGFSILAYAPAIQNSRLIIPVKPEDIKRCENSPIITPSSSPSNLQKTDIELAADDAESKGIGIIQIKSTNPKNVKTKMDAIRKFANQRKLRVQDNGDNTVSLIKQ